MNQSYHQRILSSTGMTIRELWHRYYRQPSTPRPALSQNETKTYSHSIAVHSYRTTVNFYTTEGNDLARISYWWYRIKLPIGSP